MLKGALWHVKNFEKVGELFLITTRTGQCFCNRSFLQVGVLNPFSLWVRWSTFVWPLPCPAWVALPGAYAPAGVALWVIEVLKPSHHDKGWTMWQQSSFCHAQEHLVIQGDQDKNQTLHLQLQCEVSLALRMRNLEDDKGNATENPDILQHLSAAHLQHPTARDDPNEDLWERVGQETVAIAKQILKRRWGWIGHTLRKPASSITRQALTWNPQGKRKRGWPRTSWRRDTEAELKQQGTNWTGAARLAQNRVQWQGVIDGLCSTWSHGP